MSKVLIDRELLERVQERLDPHRDAVLWGAVCDTFHTAPSGTPTMPVKAYYHEAPNEYGGLNKSVGLEVRKAFIDAPLVLESDALTQIACLEGEIVKRDARIAELEADLYRASARVSTLKSQWRELAAELAALKEQEPAAYIPVDRETGEEWHPVLKKGSGNICDYKPLYAAPVSEAKAQGEYGEAYQGAREDLAIWKRRALEAEEKVLQQEQIIDHLTSEAQGESRFGEPVVTPDAPCVPDGYVLADKKALGTVLQALVNAPHHIRELQVTRQPVELFSDNPINVLIANYEAPAAPVQQPKCRTCDDNGLIGGPSFYSPDEGGDPCTDCCAPVQQVSAQDKFCIGAWRDALEKIAKYAPQVNCAARTELERAGLIAVHALIAFSAPQLRPARGTQTASNAAQAAPAADAGHVFYGMDGNHP